MIWIIGLSAWLEWLPIKGDTFHIKLSWYGFFFIRNKNREEEIRHSVTRNYATIFFQISPWAYTIEIFFISISLVFSKREETCNHKSDNVSWSKTISPHFSAYQSAFFGWSALCGNGIISLGVQNIWSSARTVAEPRLIAKSVSEYRYPSWELERKPKVDTLSNFSNLIFMDSFRIHSITMMLAFFTTGHHLSNSIISWLNMAVDHWDQQIQRSVLRDGS